MAGTDPLTGNSRPRGLMSYLLDVVFSKLDQSFKQGSRTPVELTAHLTTILTYPLIQFPVSFFHHANALEPCPKMHPTTLLTVKRTTVFFLQVSVRQS